MSLCTSSCVCVCARVCVCVCVSVCVTIILPWMSSLMLVGPIDREYTVLVHYVGDLKDKKYCGGKCSYAWAGTEKRIEKSV